VMIGDPGRSYLPKSGLLEVARHRVPTSLELEDRTERETVIWRLLPE
jgi:predicted nicotinamide N-methyase